MFRFRIGVVLVMALFVVPVVVQVNDSAEVVSNASASGAPEDWSTRDGLSIGKNFFGQAVYHEGQTYLFWEGSVHAANVGRFEPPATVHGHGTVPLFGAQLQREMLPVSHGEHIYIFGSDSSTPEGLVKRYDPVSMETTTIASGVAVGVRAAGVSAGQYIYLFPGVGAGLDSQWIWRFDPATGALVQTSTVVPYWDGTYVDARFATALWTGHEIVLLGGAGQKGRITTWVPGTPSMEVLPFLLGDDDRFLYDGHAVWSGATIFVFGQTGPDHVQRITLHPPKQERISPDLVKAAYSGDAIWDGRDAYVFRYGDIIRFHPWESDLPRFTLGQDFTFADLTEKSAEVHESLLCSEAYRALGPGALLVDQEIWESIFEPHETFDHNFCVKGLFDFQSSLAFWPGEGGLPGDGPGQLRGDAISAFVLLPGGAVRSLADAGITLVTGARQALPNLLAKLDKTDPVTSLSHGGHFVMDRGCPEQSDRVGATVTFDYLAAGRVASSLIGQASAWSVMAVEGQPQHAIGKPDPLPNFQLDSIASAVSPQWWPLIESDSDEFAHDFNETPVEHSLSAGLSFAFARLTGMQIAQAGVGASASVLDAAGGDDGFELLEIRYDFVDESAPAITIEADGPEGRNGWFLGPIQVRAQASDGQSCVREMQLTAQPSPLPVRSDDPWSPMVAVDWSSEGTQGFAVDAVNFQDTTGQAYAEFAIDSVPPESSHQLTGTGQNGWYRSCVTLDIDTVDAVSGPAERFSERVGDGRVDAVSRQFCADGIHPFSYWALDKAGNREEANAGPTLQIDRTRPIGATGTYVGTEGVDDWYRSCVVVPIQGWDALSGLDFTEYAVNDEPYVQGTEATVCDEGIHEIHVIAHDVAGNTGGPPPSGVKIDTTTPDVSVTVSVASVDVTQVDWTASDDLSGLYGQVLVEYRTEPIMDQASAWEELCSAPVSGEDQQGSCEAPIEELGDHCFRAHARDRAGNWATSDERCTLGITL